MDSIDNALLCNSILDKFKSRLNKRLDEMRIVESRGIILDAYDDGYNRCLQDIKKILKENII